MTDPDRRLALEAAGGDRRALSRLYGRYRSRLLGFLVKQLRDRSAAEDVLQEVWIKVLRNVEGYRVDPGSFRAWLYRIAANAATDHARRARLRAGPELDAPAGDDGARIVDRLPSAAPGPEQRHVATRLGRDIERALEQLPERQRAAVLLRHQQGLSYAELAAVLSVPEGTAKTLVHRGVRWMREHLGEWKT